MRKILLIAIVLSCSFLNSFCQDIYTYVASSTAGAPSYVDPNITAASNLTAVGTGTSTPCAQGFSGITGFTGPAYSPAGPCIQISLTAIAGYTITAIGFKTHIRNSATGPTMVRLAYSSDGGLSWIDDGVDYASLTGSCATTTSGTNLVNWSPFSVTNTTLLFRVYPFAAPGGGGTVQIFDLDIIGNVHPLCVVPPPITVAPSVSNICVGGSGAILTASGAGPGGTYSWAPSTGLSSAFGAMVTATPGSSVTYTVTGTTSLGCTNTAPAVVNVNSLPSAPVSVSGPVTFCPGGSAIISTPAIAGCSYAWYNDISIVPGAVANAYIATTSGNYKVQVINSFGCSTTSVPVTITEASVPPAAITASGSTAFCSGSGVLLSTLTGSGFSYQWYQGSSIIPGATNSSYTDLVSGSISVRVTNAFGCARTSLAVSTAAVPLPFVVPSGSTSFCANGNVLMTVHTTGSTPGITYQWERSGSNIAGATSATYTGNLTGSYQCIVNIGTGSCVDTSMPLNVLVHPAPVAPVSFNGTLLSTGSHYLSYQWFVNGVRMTGATTYFTHPIAGIGNGVYTVKVTDSNGCSGVSNPFILTGTPSSGLSVGNVNGEDIKIYPNPASNFIRVESQNNVRAAITGVDGKVLIEEADAHEINIISLANGMYIITLFGENNERLSVQKIIKQ